jgi:hypothetical protein
MSLRTFFRSILPILVCSFLSGGIMASADTSHARIVRLSLVQGDVRFARETHGDPLADDRAGWDAAQLNLPLAQGNVIATDSGRAAVEFENGTMAFLGENTVIQLYDLSLQDGARTTRLVLLQGNASFTVNPTLDEYFSVTGGDFTVEASGRSTFRVNTFDDGSNVAVRSGRVSVLHKKDTRSLTKGMSLSIKAGDDSSLSVGNAPTADNFDKWAANRVEAINAANNASMQYTGSSAYAPGFADLYTYGAWSSCGGAGFGWRPFGANLGWSPFSGGSWYADPTFGWTYVSMQPWGWAPYHYGGWLFDASCGGWFYSPGAYGYGYPGVLRKKFPPRVNPPHPIYHASTAVFVRQNGKIGIVPMHPLDQKGETPLNIGHGVLPATSAHGLTAPLTALNSGQKFETLKSAPKEAFSSSLTATSAPARVPSSMVTGTTAMREVTLGKGSAMAFDAGQHRFVTVSATTDGSRAGVPMLATNNGRTSDVRRVSGSSVVAASSSARVSTPAAPGRSASPPSRSVAPPPARSSGGSYGGGSGASASRGSSGGGWSGASASSGSSSRGSSGSSGSSSSSGGGRPH